MLLEVDEPTSEGFSRGWVRHPPQNFGKRCHYRQLAVLAYPATGGVKSASKVRGEINHSLTATEGLAGPFDPPRDDVRKRIRLCGVPAPSRRCGHTPPPIERLVGLIPITRSNDTKGIDAVRSRAPYFMSSRSSSHCGLQASAISAVLHRREDSHLKAPFERWGQNTACRREVEITRKSAVLTSSGLPREEPGHLQDRS
jgi:hypothetical protein